MDSPRNDKIYDMNFSLQFVIDPKKILQYLLVLQQKNDKSQFLAKYGYSQNNWQQLQQDILTSSRPADTFRVGTTT